MPLYNSDIETLENLQYVADVVSGFNQDRFLAALMGKKHIAKEQLIRMRLQLSEVNDRLEAEYNVLFEFGKTFNDRFTTYNNACFSSAMELLKKVRSGMSSMVNIYRKFAPQNIVAMRAANPNVTDLDLYARSAMAGADYTPPLFDATAFAPEVLDLYDTMKRFMTIMADSLQLCEDILEEEAQIRHNPQACLDRYKVFKEKHRRRIQDMLNSINLTSRDFLAENNPAIRLRKESKDELDFSQQGFHNLSVPATTALAAKEIVEEAQRGIYTQEELVLFDERERILTIRYIIEHFDNFLPISPRRKNIPADYVACFLWWCNIPLQRNKPFVLYFADTYSNGEGKLKPPSNSAVNQAKRTEWKSKPEFAQLISIWESVKIS